MTVIAVNELDEAVRSKLYAQAKLHGCSVEQEAKDILAAALAVDVAPSQRKEYKNALLQDIRELVEPLGGIELELPSRDEPMRTLPEF